MAAELQARLIVLDTGPLITLAAAECLDYLLYPTVPVFLPDAVLYEATQDAGALGAAAILDWAQSNSEQVRGISTQVFFNYVETREMRPGRRKKDLGERAAIEAIHDSVRLAPDERAILLTEDDRVLRRVLVTGAELTRRILPLTTRDYLDALESAGRINSADEVYRRAEVVGRPIVAQRFRISMRPRAKPSSVLSAGGRLADRDDLAGEANAPAATPS